MIRIGIDARALYSKNGKGLKSYIYHLVNNLKDIDRNNRYYLFYNEPGIGGNGLELPESFSTHQFHQRGGERFFLWEQLNLPMALTKIKVDVFHSPGNTLPALNTHNAILTLHDMLMFEEDVKNFRGKHKLYMHYFQPILYRKVANIITVSNYSKDRIVERLSIDPDKITVIYNGIGDEFRLIDEDLVKKTKIAFGIEGDYVFTVGANTGRKNLPTLIKGYLDLARHTRLKEKLIISGIGEKTRKMLEIEFPEIISKRNVILLPYVSIEDLVSLYNGAKLFVFPSLGEGFGLPPLEAMACGIPVIASNYTSIPEVLGNAAYLVHTKDHQKIAKAIRMFLENEDLRQEFKTKGLARAKHFSWRKTAEETLQIYCKTAQSLGVNN